MSGEVPIVPSGPVAEPAPIVTVKCGTVGCRKPSAKFREAGCRVDRSAEAVVKKIQDTEGKFITAHDWANNTGQGVKERDGMDTFEDCVRKRCPWYFELLPIVGDRSKARPRVTSRRAPYV